MILITNDPQYWPPQYFPPRMVFPHQYGGGGVGGGGGPRLHFVPANFAHQMPLHPYLVSSVSFSYWLALFVSLFFVHLHVCSLFWSYPGLSRAQHGNHFSHGYAAVICFWLLCGNFFPLLLYVCVKKMLLHLFVKLFITPDIFCASRYSFIVLTLIAFLCSLVLQCIATLLQCLVDRLEAKRKML